MPAGNASAMRCAAIPPSRQWSWRTRAFHMIIARRSKRTLSRASLSSLRSPEPAMSPAPTMRHLLPSRFPCLRPRCAMRWRIQLKAVQEIHMGARLGVSVRCDLPIARPNPSSTFHTQGGLAVDTQRASCGRTVSRSVASLREVGLPQAFPGQRGSDGYVSGNGLLSALGLGLIAGREAARHAAGQRAALQTKVHHNVQQGEMT